MKPSGSIPKMPMPGTTKARLSLPKGNTMRPSWLYDEAIRLEPNHAAAWSNKGIALDAQSKYIEAIKAYDEAIRLDPNYASARNNKGVALNAQGKYDEAIKAYDEASSSIPTMPMLGTTKAFLSMPRASTMKP